MTAHIIDGKEQALRLKQTLRPRVRDFERRFGRPPGLAVVLVGDDPASQIYVRTKARQAAEIGISSQLFRLGADIEESELSELVDQLNTDNTIDGILIQLPLPNQISAAQILRRIDPGKDVDGLHPLNAGLLASGQDGGVIPCTPLGCLNLIQSVQPDLQGLDATVIGKSAIVGRPMGQLLLNNGCTVTTVHLATRDVRAHCRNADIIVAAAGAPELVQGDWVKDGAIVIDVGITRVQSNDGDTKIFGDVDFDVVRQVAGAITPVPGGVGPMTVAMLLSNTIKCALQGRIR